MPAPTTRLRFINVLATAAARLAAVAPAGASGGKPANYGTCISQAAMSGGSVREWTQSYSPIVGFGDRVISPPGGDEIGLACRIEEADPQHDV